MCKESRKSVLKRLFKEVFTLKEMLDYYLIKLDDQDDECSNFTDSGITSIVSSSLLPIETKSHYAKLLDLTELSDECDRAINNMQSGDGIVFTLTELHKEDVFQYLMNDVDVEKKIPNIKDCLELLQKEYGFYEDYGIDYFVMPLQSMKEVKQFIIKDLKSENDWYKDKVLLEEYNKRLYYKVDKWIKKTNEISNDKDYINSKGDMIQICSFILINGDPVYYQEKKYRGSDIPLSKSFCKLSSGRDLNIPIPFKTGDLIHTDMRPFMEDRNLLVLEVGDNRDCCSVQVAYVDELHRLKAGPLKHTRISIGWLFYCTSPLYSLRRINESELKPYEKCLIDIKNEIGDDEKKGYEMWERLTSTHEKK